MLIISSRLVYLYQASAAEQSVLGRFGTALASRVRQWIESLWFNESGGACFFFNFQHSTVQTSNKRMSIWVSPALNLEVRRRRH